MPDEGKPQAKGGTFKKILTNPLVLIGGGVVVLLVMLKSGGQGGGGASGGGTASAVQAALDAQTKAQNDALASQTAAVQAALKAQHDTTDQQLQQNAAALAAALKLQTPAPQAPPDATQPGALEKLQATLQAEIDALKTANPFAGAGTVSTDPNTPGATAALNWSRNIGVPYEWGIGFIQHFGRLPSSIAELNVWRAMIGGQTSDGKWCINGACI